MAKTTKTPPPEARLISGRREEPGLLKKPISIRAAARRAAELSGDTFSEPNWRRIEKGDKKASDRELVFMAEVVGVTPEELQQVGRETAAQTLREWTKERTRANPILSGIDPDVTPESVQQSLHQMLGEIDALPGLSEAARKQMRKVLLEHLDTTLQTYSAQLHILRPR